MSWPSSLSLSGILSRVVIFGGVEAKEAMQCKRKTGKERAAGEVFARKGKVSGANENEREPTDTGTFANTSYINVALKT